MNKTQTFSNMTHKEILDKVQSLQEHIAATTPPCVELTVMCVDHLPPGFMAVAPDVYALFRKLPGKEGN